MSLKTLATSFCMLALSFMAFTASADYWGGHRSQPGPAYGYGRWQYAGQRSGPNHGSPWGINYCNTESPQYCQPWERGQLCYINSGYWWDNANQCNWFNVYQCQ